MSSSSPSPPLTTKTTIHCFLSPDCRGYVFQFLSLFECLKYGQISKRSLEHIIIELDVRRSNQFLIRPFEELTTCMERIFSSSSSSFAIRPQDLLLDVIPTTTTTTTTSSNNTASTTRANNDNDNTHKSNQPKQPFLHRLLEEENNNDNNHDKDNEHNKQPRRSFYALPSVLERIEGLYQSIPNSHPFNNDIRNLISDLKNKNKIKVNKKGDDNDNDNDDDSKNNNLIRRLSSVTYSHRLHASLLSRCTVRLEPDPYYQNNHHRNNNNNNNDESFTVTLERYIGDVLSARCLIGHSYIGGSTSGNMAFVNNSDSSITGGGIDAEKVIVEGGPSFDKWIDYLISFQQIASVINIDDRNRIPSAKDWYQYWVFLHSALLRVSPFSIRQADKLKIGPFSGIVEPFDINNNGTTGNENDDERNHQDHRQQQDTWFLPSRTFACYSCKCRYVKVLSDRMSPLFRHNNQRVGVLQTTLNDFGPLGNFRGRDRVSTQVMLPHKLYVILLRNMLLSWKLNNNRLHNYIDRDNGTTGREHVTDLRRWLNGSDRRGVMQWMKLLQDQSQKNHPMTVQPPLVTIRMTTNNMERQRLADR
ncbi:hypothetical protein FRACYDRAFT_246470 [Fragilariopsis cylindrus CCMP1102]|uniref:Uncharacterized protein n=1 Tax=Fragilariopsis cylindrus CCMP1102 TaxID=635003 RepID=A0A1E7EY23_9STRA|nr:hypothetical protein FRACYDRAFT_246470 [Fragilariopsis cylindrus CCMP1102]|eukprot:OEU10719.1 hypothetical protein FRACYDRAFT_246470 [Fragilariopsis cylindrus CCMP1102]